MVCAVRKDRLSSVGRTWSAQCVCKEGPGSLLWFLAVKTMGRKPTPQPLNLADSAVSKHDNTPLTFSHSRAAPSLDSKSLFAQRSAPLPSTISSNRPQTARSASRTQQADDPSHHHQYAQTTRDKTSPSYPPLPGSFETSHSFPLQQSQQPPPGDTRKPSRSGFFTFNKGPKVGTLETSQSAAQVGQRDQLASRDGDDVDFVQQQASKKTLSPL